MVICHNKIKYEKALSGLKVDPDFSLWLYGRVLPQEEWPDFKYFKHWEVKLHLRFCVLTSSTSSLQDSVKSQYKDKKVWQNV